MAQPTSIKDLILAGYGGYRGWGETEALADFRNTGGAGKEDASVALEVYPNEVSDELAEKALEEEIANIVIEYDEQMSNIPLVLTDEEKEQFLQKAIDQITPYYEEKKEEIQAGIKEGKIRTAEDILSKIREVRQETDEKLANYRVWEAETEEEFVNNIADITATKEEDLEMKRADWRDRIRQAKQGQVQTGVLTSGIGRKRVGEMLDREQMETGAIERRAEQARTEAETGRKYDLKRIALARESAERERIRQIGGPGEEADTTEAALATTGYGSLEELPSEAELARLRSERNQTVYRPEALTDIEEERKRAIESRRMELETQEEAIRRQRREQLKKQTLADLARDKKRYGSAILGSYLA